MSFRSAQTQTNLQTRRNPFPEAYFFFVPLKLYETGLAAHLSGSEFKRYVTLLRISNYDYGNREVKVNLKELETLDGVSPRSAFQVHTRLQEYGLLLVDRRTKPFTYTLRDPDMWTLPDFQLRKFHRENRLHVTKAFAPVPW
ncbi:MAG: hypothetical protein EPN47_10215 [Acidobacteria bacterium]|nr:MAG: hypothetical protein EPN47_10215 [Acidobacteriota bacterium]